MKNGNIYGMTSTCSQVDREKALRSELARTGVALETVLKRYVVINVQSMSDDIYIKAMNGLRKTKDKVDVA